MASAGEFEQTTEENGGFLSGLKGAPGAIAFSVILIVGIGGRAIQTNAHFAAILAVVAIWVGSILGYLRGGALARRVERSIDKTVKNRHGSRFLNTISSDIDSRCDSFLTFTATSTMLYIGMYFEAIRTFPPDPGALLGLSIKPVVILTAVTVFFMGMFSVRYANYIKMTRSLESVVRDGSGRDKSFDDKILIQSIREAVFRDAQIYEPPGNVFVTLGITATFLGLAVALIGLDLPSGLPARRHGLADRLCRLHGPGSRHEHGRRADGARRPVAARLRRRRGHRRLADTRRHLLRAGLRSPPDDALAAPDAAEAAI